MSALLDYIFYCFFCLTSAKNADRVGAARAGLFLFVVFIFMDLYTLLAVATDSKPHFLGALLCMGFLLRLALVRYYFPHRFYTEQVAHYEQAGEPRRVQYALTGLCLLLTSLFLPFLILKVGR